MKMSPYIYDTASWSVKKYRYKKLAAPHFNLMEECTQCRIDGGAEPEKSAVVTWWTRGRGCQCTSQAKQAKSELGFDLIWSWDLRFGLIWLDLIWLILKSLVSLVSLVVPVMKPQHEASLTWFYPLNACPWNQFFIHWIISTVLLMRLRWPVIVSFAKLNTRSHSADIAGAESTFFVQIRLQLQAYNLIQTIQIDKSSRVRIWLDLSLKKTDLIWFGLAWFDLLINTCLVRNTGGCTTQHSHSHETPRS